MASASKSLKSGGIAFVVASLVASVFSNKKLGLTMGLITGGSVAFTMLVTGDDFDELAEEFGDEQAVAQ